MAAERSVVLAGGCQCGAVRYALFARPARVHLCHCRLCQRAVGNAFAALAPVRWRDFAWTEGESASYPSSDRAMRDFCSKCGTPLAFRYMGGDWIDVTIGSLDDPNAVAPELNYGVESRLEWLGTILSLPGHETGAGGLTGTS